MKKTALIAAALVTAISASSAFACGGDHNNNDMMDGYHMGHGMQGKPGHHGMKGMKMREQMNRNYTADEIKTLIEARLLRKGNDNITIGQVTPTNDGYKVTIVTKQGNALVKELNLAKNSMPLDRYNAMQKRMEAWEKRQNG